jgi:hypothetical protein
VGVARDNTPGREELISCPLISANKIIGAEKRDPIIVSSVWRVQKKLPYI